VNLLLDVEQVRVGVPSTIPVWMQVMLIGLKSNWRQPGKSFPPRRKFWQPVVWILGEEKAFEWFLKYVPKNITTKQLGELLTQVDRLFSGVEQRHDQIRSLVTINPNGDERRQQLSESIQG
jgi:hypothetical protein